MSPGLFLRLMSRRAFAASTPKLHFSSLSPSPLDHLFFLIVFRSPNLGNTMFDFLPRRLMALLFLGLVVLAVVSMSIAASGTKSQHLCGSVQVPVQKSFSYCPSCCRLLRSVLSRPPRGYLASPSLVLALVGRQSRVVWLRDVAGARLQPGQRHFPLASGCSLSSYLSGMTWPFFSYSPLEFSVFITLEYGTKVSVAGAKIEFWQ